MANFPIAHPERRDKGLLTENATATTIDTINVKTERTFFIKSFITVSRNTSSAGGTAGDAATYELSGAFRDTAGTLEQIGSTVKTASKVDLAWDADYAVSGTNVLIRVTGEASTDIDWRCYSTIYKDKA